MFHLPVSHSAGRYLSSRVLTSCYFDSAQPRPSWDKKCLTVGEKNPLFSVIYLDGGMHCVLFTVTCFSCTFRYNTFYCNNRALSYTCFWLPNLSVLTVTSYYEALSKSNMSVLTTVISHYETLSKPNLSVLTVTTRHWANKTQWSLSVCSTHGKL